MNAALLSALNPSDLVLSDTLGGPSIGFLLAHIAHFRHGWVRDLAPELVGDSFPTLQRGPRGEALILVHDLDGLARAFRTGDAASLQAVQAARAAGQGVGPGSSDPTMMLARILSHDAHHRGQIMSILRIHGAQKPGLGRLLFESWSEA